MRRKFLITSLISTFLLLTISLCLFSSEHKKEVKKLPIGFVASIKGKGYVIRDNKKILLSGMDIILSSDKIKVMHNSTININICSKKGFEIKGESIFTITNEEIIFEKGKFKKEYNIDKKICEVMLGVISKNQKRIRIINVEEKEGTIILRGETDEAVIAGTGILRGLKDATLLKVNLKEKKVLPHKPFFIWNRVNDSVLYKVNIMKDSETILSVDTDKNYMEYPDNAPKLLAKVTYEIKIQALDEQGEVVGEGSEKFSVFDKNEAQIFDKEENYLKEMINKDKDNAGLYILLGQFYESYGLIIDAIENYEKALNLDPENLGLKDRMDILRKELM